MSNGKVEAFSIVFSHISHSVPQWIVLPRWPANMLDLSLYFVGQMHFNGMFSFVIYRFFG